MYTNYQRSLAINTLVLSSEEFPAKAVKHRCTVWQMTDPLPLWRLHFCVRNRWFENKVFFKKRTSAISPQKPRSEMYCFISSLTHQSHFTYSLYRLGCDFTFANELWKLGQRSWRRSRFGSISSLNKRPLAKAPGAIWQDVRQLYKVTILYRDSRWTVSTVPSRLCH